MNNYKSISIVIPTYNRAHLLEECIDSCLKQTHKCEIIVVDHGSTDNTSKIANSYGHKIRYIRRELDSGVHFCWLDGILHATSDLIHLNFDDDWILPTYIEECLTLFNDDVGFVLSNASIFNDDTKKIDRKSIFELDLKTGIHDTKKIIKYNLNTLTSPGAGVYRKNVLIENLFVGKVPFTQQQYRGVGPDILFSLMSCQKFKKFGFVNEPLAIFRAHPNSITVDSGKNIEKWTKIQLAYRDARIFYIINQLFNNTFFFNLGRILLKFLK